MVLETFSSSYTNAIKLQYFICDIAVPLKSAAVLVRSYSLTKYQHVDSKQHLILNCFETAFYCITLPVLFYCITLRSYAMFLLFTSQH